MSTIRAAGAVLWRDHPHDGIRIAVVHRPRYDDWSLPKGKLHDGETLPAAAVREVAEETGFTCVLERFIAETSYVVAKRAGGEARKTVGYFSAHARTGGFRPNDEVDELDWLGVAQAREKLSYDLDRAVVNEFTAISRPLTTLLLVRHAKAGSREDWAGDDDLRPLTEDGQRQAESLRRMLTLFGPSRVVAAPRVRCVQTVRAIAEDLGAEIEHEPLLSEEGYTSDPDRGIARLLSVVRDGGTPLVSSQGKVIPDVVTTLAARDGVPIADVRAKKGSLWLLAFTHNGSGPHLASAHYFPGT